MVHSNALGFWPYPRDISAITIAIDFAQHARLKCGLSNLRLKSGFVIHSEAQSSQAYFSLAHSITQPSG